MTISDDGLVTGHAAAWGVCHTGMPGRCQTAPKSNTGYAYFHTGEIRTREGRVAVGPLTVRGDHAGTRASIRAARSHYADTSLIAADVRLTDGDVGIWMSGALRPALTDEQLREVMGASPSGDWRWVNGALEMIHVHCVPTPGFPTPRVLVADGEPLALVACGGYQACECEEISRLTGRILGADGLLDRILG